MTPVFAPGKEAIVRLTFSCTLTRYLVQTLPGFLVLAQCAHIVNQIHRTSQIANITVVSSVLIHESLQVEQFQRAKRVISSSLSIALTGYIEYFLQSARLRYFPTCC